MKDDLLEKYKTIDDSHPNKVALKVVIDSYDEYSEEQCENLFKFKMNNE